MAETEFSISIRLLEKYLFEIDFGEFGNFMTDEPAPLGDGEGPNPARLLAASVGNCLAASLLFALRKYGDEPSNISATIAGHLERVEKRWRIAQLNVVLNLDGTTQSLPHLEKALAQFEDFCVVTQSVRAGIPVKVQVVDAQGKSIF